jgi:predicted outer membrane repeat protein
MSQVNRRIQKDLGTLLRCEQLEDRVTPAPMNYVVNNPLDVPIAGVDRFTGFALMNLRQAITAANANAGIDTIEFSNQALSNEIYTALPTIIEGVSLAPTAGLGPATVFRQSQQFFRIFTIDIPANQAANGVSFEQVWVKGGRAINNGGPNASDGPDGGGVWSRNASVVMTDCRVFYNSAAGDGGGIYATGGTNSFFEFRGSQGYLIENQATRDGGGAYAYNIYFKVKFDGHVVNNTAGRNGGGIAAVANNFQGLKLLEVISSSVTANTNYGDGGGIYVNNQVGPRVQAILVDTDITDNRAFANQDPGGNFVPGRGGGLCVLGGVDLIANAQTMISENGEQWPAGGAPPLLGVFLDPTPGAIDANFFFATITNDNYLL